MIILFRRIRQQLLAQNKLSKYIFYAFGEIILVVIGILIALQINNWNEAHKATQTETVYLNNIVRDLNEQLKSIDIQAKQEEEFFNISLSLLNDYYTNNTLTMDSLFFNRATLLTIRRTFVVNDPTFTDLVSSGNIKLIKDLNKKDQIIQYYQDLERIEKIVQNNNSLLIDQSFVPIYNKYGYYASSAMEGFTLLKSKAKVSKKLLKQSERLTQLSSNLITEKEELELINAISHRHTVANGHMSYMKTLKALTTALIETLSND